MSAPDSITPLSAEERGARAAARLDAAHALASPWLTTAEAAAYARRGKRQIREAVKTGKLRAALVGGKRQCLTRRDWIDTYLEDLAAPVIVPVRRRA